jgi:tetratricopeptide (TPR) repeat protein
VDRTIPICDRFFSKLWPNCAGLALVAGDVKGHPAGQSNLNAPRKTGRMAWSILAVMLNGPMRSRAIIRACLVSLGVCAAAMASARQADAQVTRQVERFEPAESIDGNYLSALIAGAAKDSSAAAVFLREAVKADPRNAELLERAFVAFLADGSMNDAFRAAERLVKIDSSNGLAQLALGVRALRQKQYQTARAILHRSGRGRAADITATLITGWAFAGAGETAKAIETIDRLKGESTYNQFRDYNAGLVYDLANNVPEATKRLKSAFDAERTQLRLMDVWGRFQARRGQAEAAKLTYSDFDKILPNHPVARDALNRLEKGEPLPRLISTAQQGAAEVLYGLGSVGNRQGDEIAAQIYLRLALYLDPTHDLALLTLGDILERIKQFDDAIVAYERIPESSPLRGSAELQVGLSLQAMERTDEAVAHLKAVIERRPDDLDALSTLGNVYQSRKRHAEAVEVFDKAVSKLTQPGAAHWALFYQRGAALERIKQWDRAEADFRKALSLIPPSLNGNRGLVLNYLGYSLVDRHLKIDEAFEMLKTAVELRPRDAAVIDSLGWAYYRLGRYEDALRELERAVQLKPSDSVINDHLGDAYWKVGRKLEASFQWNHARDLNPEPEDLPRILKKIESGLEETPNAAAAGDVKKDGG